MPRIDLVKKTAISRSGRARQLEAMFDVPSKEESVVEWHGELPVDDIDWNVGLIVGPSGCGKSSILEHAFGRPTDFNWSAPSVIDDFDRAKTMVEVSEACSAVGFNTIPSWLRPYAVLSNGERFRVDLARRLVECQADIVVDEFTSVVDRQVGQIASHAVQKYVRKSNRRFVAASCHYDIIEWLQPDWILEPTTMKFTRRSLQRRPPLDITISRIPHALWEIFAPFHYMSADLHPTARCWGLFVRERIASFCAVLHRPVAQGTDKKIFGISRVVTLPDWQGLGLAPLLDDTLGAAFTALGFRFRNYPAHPAFIRVHAASKNWRMVRKPGTPQHFTRSTHKVFNGATSFGGRPCAVFEYIGPALDAAAARRLLA